VTDREPGAGAPESRSPVRVRYAETDQMGVVYYANYFVWFEIGRTDLLRSLGSTYRQLEAEGFTLPVIEAACQYAAPCLYDDELVVVTQGVLLSPIRVAFSYAVERPDGTVAARGRTEHAAIGADGRPRRLPAFLREALAPAADRTPAARG
jgi:acyl-CoA thioester hydrolase